MSINNWNGDVSNLPEISALDLNNIIRDSDLEEGEIKEESTAVKDFLEKYIK